MLCEPCAVSVYAACRVRRLEASVDPAAVESYNRADAPDAVRFRCDHCVFARHRADARYIPTWHGADAAATANRIVGNRLATVPIERPMEIVHYPHPALSWKSRPVTEIDQALRQTVRRMFELMYEHRGVGLAANQVALPLRLFVVNVTGDPEQTAEERVFINPQIIRRKGSVEGEEGCLSLPGVYGQVRRAERIVVEAFDLSGQAFELECGDLAARVVQHETDHLDGIMFIDRMSESDRRELAPQLAEFEARFRQLQRQGRFPSDEKIRQELRALEPA